MLPRDRVLAVLNHHVPDRVPKALSFYPITIDGLTDSQVASRLGADVRFVEFEPTRAAAEFEQYLASLPAGVDIGCVPILRGYSEWKYRPDIAGVGPLSSVSESSSLGGYSLPDITAAYRSKNLAAQVAAAKGQGYAVAGSPPHLGGEIFESAWRLRGFNTFMLELAVKAPFAYYLLDQLTALAAENAGILAAAGVDVLVLDDDIGMPTTMIISPETWREFLKPRVSAVIQAARQINPDIRVLYHSDGYYDPIIPDLIEIGVDALNPLQPDHVDTVGIKRVFGDRIAIWGGVGSQTLFTSGSVTEIRAAVKRAIETLGHGGGFIACPAYDVDYAVDFASLQAFADAVDDFGSY